MDALRVSDGAFITLKRLKPDIHPYEIEIARYLSSDALAMDDNNYCVPIIDVLYPDDAPEFALLVMPLLKQFDRPEFDTVGEVVECLRQYIEVRSLSLLCSSCLIT